ncbi:MAG TPA: potassium-transporting ATPase subunit KdpC [Edaphobacter sp.]|nr:potassium-transporting ATPase subunit KdpC [Edaphobacter sp.]
MRKNLTTALLYTVITTVLLGVFYPLLMTGLAQVLFRDKANGQLIEKNGAIVGSRILGQSFTGAGYFHPRPSAAGTNGYDASSSSGSNYGPTNKKYIDRVATNVADLQKENPGAPIPVDLVTTSGSGLDPDITPAGAEFQIPRVAKARGLSAVQLNALIAKHTLGREFGLLGEPRVNVLELNLDLDTMGSQRAEK